MCVPVPSTKDALLEAHKRLRTLDAVISHCEVGVSKGTLSRILRGESISYRAENEVRRGLNLPPRTVEVDSCPDCGGVHPGRCHNKPVASVVILAPDERVTSSHPQRKRQPRHTVELDDETWHALQDRRLSGESVAACARRLLTLRNPA